MKKASTISMGLARVAVVSALSVGALGAALIGVNNFAFAYATGGSATLPIEAISLAATAPAATANVQGNRQMPSQQAPQRGPGPFEGQSTIERQSPGSDMQRMPERPQQSIPANAISTEAATQIGAQYILDVFGESIEGMHVDIFFTAWPGHSRQHWGGRVTLSEDPRAQNGVMYNFLIDAITGERIDISRIELRQQAGAADELMRNWRMSDDMRTLSEMEDNALMAYLGFTQSQLEYYTEQAIAYAQRHFEDSTVASAVLGRRLVDMSGTPMLFSGLQVNPAIDANGNVRTVIGSLAFTITDSTGREAFVSVTTAEADFQHVSISTQANDVMPGFNYERHGVG